MASTKHSPLRAIRAKCLDCSCYNAAEVRKCTVEDCALYPYRMGKNPYYGLGTKHQSRIPSSQPRHSGRFGKKPDSGE